MDYTLLCILVALIAISNLMLVWGTNNGHEWVKSFLLTTGVGVVTLLLVLGVKEYFLHIICLLLSISFWGVYLPMHQGGKKSSVVGGLSAFKFFLDVFLLVIFAIFGYTCSFTNLKLSETISLFLMEHLNMFVFIVGGYSLYGAFGFWISWSLEASSLVSCFIHTCSLIFVGDFMLMIMSDFGCIKGYNVIFICCMISLVSFLWFMILFICKNNVKRSLGYFSASTICYNLLFFVVGGTSVGLLGFFIASLLKVGCFMLVERLKDKRISTLTYALFSIIMLGVCAGTHFYLFPGLLGIGNTYQVSLFKKVLTHLGVFEFVVYFIPTIEIICLIIHLFKIVNSCHKPKGYYMSCFKYNLFLVEILYILFNMFLLFELSFVWGIKFHVYFAIIYFISFVFLFGVYYVLSGVISDTDSLVTKTITSMIESVIESFTTRKSERKLNHGVFKVFNWTVFGVKLGYLLILIIIFSVLIYVIFDYVNTEYRVTDFKVCYTYSIFGERIIDKYRTLLTNGRYLKRLRAVMSGREFDRYCKYRLKIGYLGNLGTFRGYAYDPVDSFLTTSLYSWSSARLMFSGYLDSPSMDVGIGNGLCCCGSIFGAYFTTAQLIYFGYNMAGCNMKDIGSAMVNRFCFGIIHTSHDVIEFVRGFFVFWYHFIWNGIYGRQRRLNFTLGVKKRLIESGKGYIFEEMEVDQDREWWLLSWYELITTWYMKIFMTFSSSAILEFFGIDCDKSYYKRYTRGKFSKWDDEQVPVIGDGFYSGHFAFLFEIFMYFLEGRRYVDFSDFFYEEGLDSLGLDKTFRGTIKLFADLAGFKEGSKVCYAHDDRIPMVNYVEVPRLNEKVFLKQKHKYHCDAVEWYYFWRRDVRPPYDGRVLFMTDKHILFDALVATYFIDKKEKHQIYRELKREEYMKAINHIVKVNNPLLNTMWSREKWSGVLPWFGWNGDFLEFPDIFKKSDMVDPISNGWSEDGAFFMELNPTNRCSWNVLVSDEAVIGERYFVSDITGRDAGKKQGKKPTAFYMEELYPLTEVCVHQLLYRLPRFVFEDIGGYFFNIKIRFRDPVSPVFMYKLIADTAFRYYYVKPEDCSHFYDYRHAILSMGILSKVMREQVLEDRKAFMEEEDEWHKIMEAQRSELRRLYREVTGEYLMNY